MDEITKFEPWICRILPKQCKKRNEINFSHNAMDYYGIIVSIRGEMNVLGDSNYCHLFDIDFDLYDLQCIVTEKSIANHVNRNHWTNLKSKVHNLSIVRIQNHINFELSFWHQLDLMCCLSPYTFGIQMHICKLHCFIGGQQSNFVGGDRRNCIMETRPWTNVQIPSDCN